MVASLLVKEDISQICHRKDSKILTATLSDKHEINRLKCLLSHQSLINKVCFCKVMSVLKRKFLREIISWYKRFVHLNFVAEKVL